MNVLKYKIVLIGLVMSWLVAGPVLAAKPVEVVLKGQIEPITGYLREISQSRFILQSDGQFYQFNAEELVSVNGNKSPDRNDLGEGRLIQTSLYEKIRPNGEVEIWTNLDVENTGSDLIESVNWGATEWEMESGNSYDIRDQFGNQLPVDISPGDNGLYRISVQLPVPVAPMETVRLNLKTIRKEAAKSSGDQSWSYTYNVDFPEDRFFVRKIEFPAGTEVDVPVGWWLNEAGGRIFLHSYFYYPAHTVAPQVIEYRLP
ncbi:MAG: hypothetical protein KOO60_05935 [Gemmatimonadales bacterium]|nr:hypothetical protein [Gemmatimonadales bacterium]